MNNRAFVALFFALSFIILMVGTGCPEPVGFSPVPPEEFRGYVTFELTEDGQLLDSDSLTTIDFEFDWEGPSIFIPTYLDGKRGGEIVVAMEIFLSTTGSVPVTASTDSENARLLYLLDGTFKNSLEFTQGKIIIQSMGREPDPRETINGSYSGSLQTDSSLYRIQGKFNRRLY
jgi:hypothetical protein